MLIQIPFPGEMLPQFLPGTLLDQWSTYLKNPILVSHSGCGQAQEMEVTPARMGQEP